MNVLKRLEADVPLMAMLIGLPGSGKSTLVQNMNALLLPTGGQITVFNKDTTCNIVC